jgi:hypothetical protein
MSPRSAARLRACHDGTRRYRERNAGQRAGHSRYPPASMLDPREMAMLPPFCMYTCSSGTRFLADRHREAGSRENASARLSCTCTTIVGGDRPIGACSWRD